MDWVVMFWGASYTLGLWGFTYLGQFTYQALGYPQSDPLLTALVFCISVGLPGAISAALIGVARASLQTGVIILIGTAVAIAILAGAHEAGWNLLLAPVAWHVAFVIAMMLTPDHDHPPNPAPATCPACGYDTKGLAGAVCPECGKAGAVQHG